MAGRRLEAPAGAWIDRSRSVGFSFNGRPLRGFRGDTLASALLANGVRLVGRSFKLHRPRGIFSCGFFAPWRSWRSYWRFSNPRATHSSALPEPIAPPSQSPLSGRTSFRAR